MELTTDTTEKDDESLSPLLSGQVLWSVVCVVEISDERRGPRVETEPRHDPGPPKPFDHHPFFTHTGSGDVLPFLPFISFLFFFTVSDCGCVGLYR